MKNPLCLFMLTTCIALFFSCEKSTVSLVKRAEQGDADAQNNLGVMYSF